MQESREMFLRFSKSRRLNSCKGFIQILNWVPLRVCRSVIPACCYSSQTKIIAFSQFLSRVDAAESILSTGGHRRIADEIPLIQVKMFLTDVKYFLLIFNFYCRAFFSQIVFSLNSDTWWPRVGTAVMQA